MIGGEEVGRESGGPTRENGGFGDGGDDCIDWDGGGGGGVDGYAP